jgi:hypothetical protein
VRRQRIQLLDDQLHDGDLDGDFAADDDHVR